MAQVTVELPWPPSVNRYWRWWRGRMVITPQGRAFRSAVAERCKPLQMTAEAVRLEILLHPPDRRSRDIDNPLKALLDALEGSLVANDSQVKQLSCEVGSVQPEGLVVVRLTPLVWFGEPAFWESWKVSDAVSAPVSVSSDPGDLPLSQK